MGTNKTEAVDGSDFWPASVVKELFVEFHPEKANTAGSQAWFRRELGKRGVDVTPKTISLWFKKGVPTDRLDAVCKTIDELKGIAAERLEQRLKKVRG